MALDRLEPLVPSTEARLGAERKLVVLGPMARVLMRAKGTRVTSEGSERLPRDGPAVIVANHAGFWDPPQLITQARRVIHFMTTQGAMRDPALSHILRWFGSVPKRKGVADTSAIRGMRGWVKHGGVVGIFPEGERTWDGQPIPMLPGIERLVRLLGVPMVTARIHNADRVTPRWAHTQRGGRIHIEYDEPVSFGRRASTDEIRAHIESRIAMPIETVRRFPVRGTNLAGGLTNLLYACPNCGRLEGLIERGNEVRCHECRGRWTVTTENEIVGGPGGGPIWKAARTVDAMHAERWVDAATAGDPVLLSSANTRVFTAGEGDPVEVARGTLQLTPEGVRLADWELPLASIGSVPIDIDRRLQFITRDGDIFEAEIPLPQGSVLKWKRALDALRARDRAK